MRKFIHIVSIIILGLIVSGCGGNDSETTGEDSTTGTAETSNDGDVVTIKLGHGGAAGDILHQTVDLLSEYVEEQTNGLYKIENYGASQLGNERDLIEGVTLGTVDMTLVTNSPLGNFVPEALFYDLPGLYTDLDHVHSVADSDIVREYLAEKTLEKNLRLLAVTDGGFRNITNNKHPIYDIADLSGIKMRVQESPLIRATYEAIPGVSPTPIPIGDLYSSLEQGIIDAQENPAILINDFKFAEVQDYLTLTGHSFFPRHIFINEDLWQTFPEEVQKVFIDGTKKAEEFKNNYYETENVKVIKDLEKQGMEVNEPSNNFLEDFFEIMQKEVYPQFYDDIGGGDAEEGKRIVQEIIDMR
ncbi:TRAP transporter substrate-binding protein DctP [Virgibacillus sp. W0430]|uniref:TRAP transporter substrate-binding protein n=1 Tax=Virgibacillus sp. W0430 TaxID=3391580 RepID=UPI003F48B73A